MKTIPLKTLRISSILASLIIAQPLSASLLVYEGFDYSLSNGATMDEVTATAMGLQGDYKVTNAGVASTTFATAGLSFGSSFFPTTGGALAQSRAASGAASTASVQLNTGNQTGTLYQSYLFQITDLGTSPMSTAGLRLQDNDGVTSGSAATFSTAPDGLIATASDQSQPAVAYEDANNSVFAGNTTPVTTNTTYLALASFTNVGTALSTGSPGVATFWVLDQSGYSNWLTLGNADEANLSTYATWTATQSLTSGTIVFSDLRYQHFYIWANNADSSAATYDELRWGTTLDSVAVIPEPATTALILPVAVFLWVLRRRLGRR